MSEVNFFDQFDDAVTEGDVLQEAPRPSLLERFQSNYEQSRFQGTSAGAIAGRYTEAYDRKLALERYEALPQWETPLEGLAALAGQLAPQALPWNAPENFTPIGIGAKILPGAFAAAAPIRARIAAGAIDAAATNVAIDTGIQAVEIGGGTREAFDPLQLLGSTALGAVIGGAAGGLFARFARKQVAPESPEAPGAAAVPEPLLTPEPAEAVPGPPDAVLAPAAETGLRPILPELVSPEDVAQPPVIHETVIHEPAAPGLPPTLGEVLDDEARRVRNLPPAEGQAPPVADDLVDVPVREKRKQGVLQRPETVLEFIAKEGGVRDDAGELASRGLNARTSMTRFGPAFRKAGTAEGPDMIGGKGGRTGKGVAPDEMRRRLVEAGYLDDTDFAGGEARTTTDDLYQLIDRHLAGERVISRRDKAWQDRIDAERAGKASDAEIEARYGDDAPWVKEHGPELFEVLRENDMKPGDVPMEDLELARQFMADGAKPDDAFERASVYNQQLRENAEPGHADIKGNAGEDRQLQNLDRQGDGRRSEGDMGDGAAQLRKSAQDGAEAGDSLGESFGATHAGAGSIGRNLGGVAAAPASKELTRLKDIAEALAAALEAPVRQGRIPTKKFAGIYKLPSGVIRIRKADDFEVLTHELGHHIEQAIGSPLKAFIQARALDFAPLAYQGANKKKLPEEGFAELIRLAITNPAYAARHAPVLLRDTVALIGQHRPDMVKAMDDASAAWRDWLDRPSQEAVASTIVSGREPKYFAKARKSLDRYGLGRTIADYLSRAYTKLFDDLNPLARAADALAEIHLENTGQLLDLKVIDDPYKLARMARGAWNSGHLDISHGVVPYRGTDPASSSLRDALITAFGKPNVLSGWDEGLSQKFGAYLWSRRALGEWERFDQGLIPNPPDKLTRGDHQVNVTESEAAFPQFQAAAAMVHDFATALWTKKRDAGLITPKQYDDGLQIRDYVPGLRAFDQAGDALGRGGKKTGGGKAGFVRRFQGSRRDVINPVESLMIDAYETASAIARNDVVKALDRLARNAGAGGGAIAERIPSHEIRALNVDPLEAVQAAAREAGLADADAILMRDAIEAQIGDQKAAIFRPAVINEKGEPIVFWRDGGELQALRLADGKFGRDMFTAMTMMTRFEKNLFVELLAKPAAVARVGVTADPSFIIANFIRDQVTSWIFYGKPLKRLMRTGQGAVDELFGREAARKYNSAGGIMGGANVASLSDMRVRRDMNGLARQGWVAKRLTSFKGLLEATEISETAMRLGLFRDFYDEALARGLDEAEAMMEASYLARDYLDFDRRGSAMNGVARLIPFLNASMQGGDKINRQMIAPFFGEKTRAGDAKAAGDAAKAWARAAVVMVAGAALYAFNSRYDDFNDLSPELKATHWMIKWGDKWIAVPKPFEIAVVLNLGEASWDAIARQDPRWAENYLEGLFAVGMPPNVMEGNPVIKTAFEYVTGEELRTGQELVPDQLKGLEPWLQFTAKTSELGKTIGKAINQPPAIIDHIITNFSTSYGRNALALYDWAASDKPLPGWDDTPIVRRFIKDGSRGASSSRAFWDFVSDRTGSLEGARKSWQAMIDQGDASGAQDFLSAQDETHKAWIAAGPMPAAVRRIHPFQRAKLVVESINALRRDLASGTLRTEEGTVTLGRAERGQADDILASLAMAEARNALVMMGAKGYEGREIIDIATFHRELDAASPAIREALAARFAAGKVPTIGAVRELWPDLEDRLLRDGSDAMTRDLEARVKAQGFELQGKALKRRKRSGIDPSP